MAGRQNEATWVRALALIIIVVPGVMILRANAHAPLIDAAFAEFGRGLELPWIAMAMTDLFAGFTVMSAWIWFRESRRWVAIVVILNLWFWGNIALGVYLLWLVQVERASLAEVLGGRPRSPA